jgi:hypothetical protein
VWCLLSAAIRPPVSPVGSPLESGVTARGSRRGGMAPSREELEALMGEPSRVRNMTVMAHVDHGKTSLTGKKPQ